MTRYDRRSIALACCLSGLAGFVDALGYLQTGGYFVSFMSGNSTRFGVGTGIGIAVQAEAAGAIIGTFVAGVMLGTVVSHLAGQARKPAVLLLETLLLALAALLHGAGGALLPVAAMILAMGCENSVFQRDGEVSIGLTYMTGTLVKLGQRIAGAFLGGPPLAWLPYFLLWAGLVTGSVTGAVLFGAMGLRALWVASGFAACLTAVVLIDRHGVGRPS